MKPAQHIGMWLSQLGNRCSASVKSLEAEVRIKDYAQALSDMPLAIFCPAALEVCARKFEFFPAYSALRNFLGLWWDENKPKAPPILPSDIINNPAFDIEAQKWISYWERRKLAGFDGAERGTALHLIRGKSQVAFAYICQNDIEAASVAVKRGWNAMMPQEMEAHLKADWDDAPGILRKVRAIRETANKYPGMAVAQLGLLTAAVARHAPQHLDLIPVELRDDGGSDLIVKTRDDVVVAFERQHGRKPGELTPEQMAVHRGIYPSIEAARAAEAKKFKEPPNWQATD